MDDENHTLLDSRSLDSTEPSLMQHTKATELQTNSKLQSYDGSDQTNANKHWSTYQCTCGWLMSVCIDLYDHVMHYVSTQQ
jgi:hypothetical protein